MKLPHLVLLLLTAAALIAESAVPGNDDFAHRQVLPSTETVEVNIRRTATLGYEPLDPLPVDPGFGYGIEVVRSGSLWFEWTAPRDGLFKAAAARPDGKSLETYVYAGAALDRLTRVKNGNAEGIARDRTTTFTAQQGRKYQIAVRDLRAPQRMSSALPARPPFSPIPIPPAPPPAKANS